MSDTPPPRHPSTDGVQKIRANLECFISSAEGYLLIDGEPDCPGALLDRGWSDGESRAIDDADRLNNTLREWFSVWSDEEIDRQAKGAARAAAGWDEERGEEARFEAFRRSFGEPKYTTSSSHGWPPGVDVALRALCDHFPRLMEGLKWWVWRDGRWKIGWDPDRGHRRTVIQRDEREVLKRILNCPPPAVDGAMMRESSSKGGESVPEPHADVPYLGIRVDDKNLRIKRDGYKKTVGFAGQKLAWQLLCKFIAGGDTFTIFSDLRSIWKDYGVTDDLSRGTIQWMMADLRARLSPINLHVQNGRDMGYKIVDIKNKKHEKIPNSK